MGEICNLSLQSFLCRCEMRIIFSGDWQCQVTNLDRCTKHVNQIIELLKKDVSDPLRFYVNLGDIKEVHNPVDQRVTNFIIESKKRIREASNGFFYVRGNHDNITTQDGTPSVCTLIESLGANCVADKNWTVTPFRLLTWRPKVVQYLLLYMVPYFRDKEKQKQMFKEAYEHASQKEYRDTTCNAIGKNNFKILCFHNTVTGCDQNYFTKGQGYTPDEIGAEHYNFCIGGHIHLPQIIKPNIYYCGSPFPMSWGEVNFQHRILEISIDERKR